MSKTRIFRRNRHHKTAAISLAAVLLTAVLLSLVLTGCRPGSATPSGSSARLLTAPTVNAAPTIDGLADDSIWQQAKSLTVKTNGGPDVTLKAVVCDNMIYFLSSWPDDTNDSIDEVWQFDGTSWKKGPIDDAVAIFWNIDDSIKGFSSDGCKAVCHTSNGQPAMVIEGPKTPTGKIWSGAKQRGDIWDVSLGISNVRGAGNDYYFGIEDTYLKNPSTLTPVIKRRHDYFTNKAPLELNEWIDPNDGTAKPRWRLKSGLTFDQTPYPLLDQVQEITDYSIFREGNEVPYIIFYPLETKWGGSRDDIAAKGIWNNGRWTVEMARRLDTGHSDDIQFKAKKGVVKYYSFDVAVFNHTIIDHKYTGPLTLQITQ